MQGAGEAAKTATDDADIAADSLVQLGIRSVGVGAGGIIAGNMFHHHSSGGSCQKVVGVCALTILQTRVEVLLKLWGMPVLMA
ncbi:hypothetical protein D3C78_1432740 [compost metagenome]